MFRKLKNLFKKQLPSGVVHTDDMDDLLGDKDQINVTNLLQSQVKDNRRLEIRNNAGEVIMRIPNPEKYPEVWDDIL